MINEPKIIVKDDFFTSDFQTMYDAMCERVFKHRNELFMACCIVATAIGYILYGTYKRKVIDARITGFRNNIPQFETQKIDDFRVQRLMHKECGHTHALMFELFVPYQKYSLRFVLLHLHRYFQTDTTIEAYCLDNDIPISAFRRWQQWLKENMSLLTEIGLVREVKENRENLRKWLEEIRRHTGRWMLKSLAYINLALFQRHRMPANYMNYRIGNFRKMSSPTDSAFDN